MKTTATRIRVAAVEKVEPELRAVVGPHDARRSPIQPARRSDSTKLIHHLVFALGVVLLATGCGNHAQQDAYDRAAQQEQHVTVENAPALVAEYRRVIALEPGSAWARKATERIAAVEARVKAEELHKSVFQEHGVD